MKVKLGAILLLALLLLSRYGLAQDRTEDLQKAEIQQEETVAAPDLADIVPLASKLVGRLADLKNRMKYLLDNSDVEINYAKLESRLEFFTGQLEQLKESKGYKYNKLVELRNSIKQDYEKLEVISKPVSASIRQLETWRKEWQEVKRNWDKWQELILSETELATLQSIFDNANQTINTALDLVLSLRNAKLIVQTQSGNIELRFSALDMELNSLIQEERRVTLFKESPSMFSIRYIDQIKDRNLYSIALNGLKEISWPEKYFFDHHGWIVIIQILFSFFVIIIIYRNRRELKETKRWGFFAERPFSIGLFLGYMTTVLIYEYEGAPAIWKVLEIVVAGVSFARFMDALLEASWKKQFVNGLIGVFIITILMGVLNFPLPLFRLYIALAALVSMFLCLRWAGESIRNNESPLYSRLLRAGSIFFAFIILAEFWGKRSIASHLFVSLIHSIATVLVFLLFIYMIRGGMEWMFRNAPFKRIAVMDKQDTDAIINRLSQFVDFVVFGLILLPAILMIWGMYDSLEGATKGLLSAGFNMGNNRITVGLVIVSTGIVYGSFLISWLVQKLMADESFFKHRMERGVRLSFAKLAHYGIMIVGFLIAISTLGFEVTKITLMLSALGVGIGFGLQGIVNDFVSGLILLFERPVRVGDTIEISGKWAEINKIGLRATIVQTLDQADVIVPNSDLISTQVTNWTLSNRSVRIIIPVGVAYGSNTSLVMETLIACASSNEMVSKYRLPQVLFLNFGESSLDFELRVWIFDADNRLKIKSELNQEIDRRFREANIEIAFPQQDIHVRSLDKSTVFCPQ